MRAKGEQTGANRQEGHKGLRDNQSRPTHLQWTAVHSSASSTAPPFSPPHRNLAAQTDLVPPTNVDSPSRKKGIREISWLWVWLMKQHNNHSRDSDGTRQENSLSFFSTTSGRWNDLTAVGKWHFDPLTVKTRHVLCTGNRRLGSFAQFNNSDCTGKCILLMSKLFELLICSKML